MTLADWNDPVRFTKKEILKEILSYELENNTPDELTFEYLLSDKSTLEFCEKYFISSEFEEDEFNELVNEIWLH